MLSLKRTYFNVKENILIIAYWSLLESNLIFISRPGTTFSSVNKNQNSQILDRAGKIIGLRKRS